MGAPGLAGSFLHGCRSLGAGLRYDFMGVPLYGLADLGGGSFAELRHRTLEFVGSIEQRRRASFMAGFLALDRPGHVFKPEH